MLLQADTSQTTVKSTSPINLHNSLVHRLFPHFLKATPAPAEDQFPCPKATSSVILLAPISASLQLDEVGMNFPV